MTEDYLEFARRHKDRLIAELVSDKHPTQKRDAIFMAGSPGAGKTEVALSLVEHYGNLVVIDADYYRTLFPDYTGGNASLFQQATSWLVEQVFQYVVANGYSFVLDATFAAPSVEKKITRALKRSYQTTIFYVYQDPQLAWQFTKEREGVEGRCVPKSTFINAVFQARENVIKVKERHPDVLVHVIMKDYQNAIAEVHIDATTIALLLPQRETREELEERLNDG